MKPLGEYGKEFALSLPEAAHQGTKNPLPDGSGRREATSFRQRQVTPLPLGSA